MTDNIIKGTPPMVLLPAKNYVFKISNDHYTITLPRKGTYNELAPEIFDEDSGEFDLFDDASKILYTPSITKVLFATNKYPDLKFNQFFVPYSIHFDDDTVTLTGQIADMLLVKESEEGCEEGE